jgi:hypothetical protein
MFKKIALIIVVTVLLLMGAVFLFAKDIEISVSEKEARLAINEYLSNTDNQNVGVRVSPKTVILDFKADNSATIKSVARIDGHGYSGLFDGEFKTGVDYRPPRLYFDEINLKDGGFSIDHHTQSELEDLKKVAIDVLRRQQKDDAPQDTRQSTGNSNDKSEAVIEKLISAATLSFFERIPIYDISRSGKKGMVASLALKDVRFTEETATITLSPVTALLRILAALGMILLVLTWLLGSSLVKLGLMRLMQSETKQ